MSNPHDYPATVSEVLDDAKTYRPAAIAAVKAFARSKPWQGDLSERQVKFRVLHQALCLAYGIQPTLIFQNDESKCSGGSSFALASNAIRLTGRLSVVSFLHEFAHARGMNEKQACRWSINLFRRCFPKSWSRCRFEGHMVRRGS